MVNLIERLPCSKNIKERLNYLVDYTNNVVDDVVGIVLFGSYARCEQNMRSDIDICILTKGSFTRLQRGTVSAEYDEYGVDVVMFPVSEFFSSKSKLVKQILKDGVVIWKA